MFKKGIMAAAAFLAMTTSFGGAVALMTAGGPLQAQAARTA